MIVLILSTAPMLFLLAYTAALLGLAIYTNHAKYAFADLAFGAILVLAVIFLPIVCVAFWAGRRTRSSQGT